MSSSRHIHWYPGHIAKAQRELKEKLSLIDVVIEVIDARIPYSSWYKTTQDLILSKPRLILMNKSDLSDKEKTKIWAKKIEQLSNSKVIITDIKNKNDIKNIVQNVLELSKDITQKRLEKGLLARPIRTMVVGMPNVGKSSTINKLTKSSKTKTGAKAGVTRQQQWVRIHDKIELLDTPGIIPTTQPNQKEALKLALVNSIGENAYDSEYAAENLIEILNNLYPGEFKKYLKMEDEDEITLSSVAKKRGYILKGEKPDTRRTAEVLLSNFREGKIGNFTLEDPEECGL